MYQGCESSDFNLISDSFALHKTPFQTFNALKNMSFQAFPIILDFFSQMLSYPCEMYITMQNYISHAHAHLFLFHPHLKCDVN